VIVDRLDDQGGCVSNKLTLGVAARLSTYLRILIQSRKQGIESISSQEISEHANVNPTQVRRDLSTFGKFGKRGVGYKVESLIAQIQDILHSGGTHNIALVGAGHLGSAIATSSIFQDHGFRIAALFDSDPAKVGQRAGDLVIEDSATIAVRCRDLGVVLGVLAVPPEAAQDAAGGLVDGGVKILFNYTETLLSLPYDVTVHTINPAEEMLYALYFYLIG
jgi:redox-sensing transcriptional repressor